MEHAVALISVIGGLPAVIGAGARIMQMTQSDLSATWRTRKALEQIRLRRLGGARGRFVGSYSVFV
jgi:hypothetical protein